MMRRTILAACVAGLLTAAPALGARPATDAERTRILAGNVSAECMSQVAAVTVSDRTVAWARVDNAGSDGCPASVDLLLRLPGHVRYRPMWWSNDERGRPCWATGTAVMRDLLADLADRGCQLPRPEGLLVYAPAPPAGRTGVRSATRAERSGIGRAMYGTRTACYRALPIRVARWSPRWAAVGTPRVRTGPCAVDGGTILVRLPGSERWVKAWDGGPGHRRAPCWVAGANVTRTLLRLGTCGQRVGDDVIYLNPRST